MLASELMPNHSTSQQCTYLEDIKACRSFDRARMRLTALPRARAKMEKAKEERPRQEHPAKDNRMGISYFCCLLFGCHFLLWIRRG